MIKIVTVASVAKTVKRAFTYRCYPNEEQARQLAQTFGCVRLVYNMALHARSEAWRLRQERVSYNDSSALLTAWKKTEGLAFLNEVSSVPLQQALRHLQTAFVNFWAKRTSHPTFKSKKRSRRTAEFTASAFRLCEGQLTLAKMSAPMKIIWSRPLPDGVNPSTVTVSQDAAGRWFVSLVCEDRIESTPAAQVVGIDVGLTNLLTLSTGEKSANPRHEKRERDSLARAQRSLARKQVGSANRVKARHKVAKIHVRVTDRRRDYLHKLTTRLVRENQTIVIEDLAISNMVKNHTLARGISDAAWAQFRTMLEYKASWHGRNLVVVDRWYPSSKICSTCGAVADHLPLNIRSWVCGCGSVHDRDINAAINILGAGLALLACGGDVRPQRGSSRVRRSSMKQETQGRPRDSPSINGAVNAARTPSAGRR